MSRNGLVEVNTRGVGSDVLCYRGRCRYLEAVTVDLDIGTLRWLGDSYAPNQDNPMRVRFKTRAGVNFDTAMMPAEARGLVERVDAYRASRGFTRLEE